jgi:hypothetical protein
MTGLSYGGFFTMYTAALCSFIKVAVPSGFFKDSERESRDALINETELLPPKSIFSRIGHFQAIGLICPRPCMVQLGKIDRLFDLDDARSEAEKASKYYEKLGIRDKFEFNVHPGGHEFDNENIFRFFDQHL